ncbi:MAG TPA: hypothetical protein VJ756_02050 [Terriglobales bacterium]|jgi:hypothetical protein|nr:hypothetical protein [Terriglobales bacterium]
MITREYVHTERVHNDVPEFHEPEAWLGHAPKKEVKICFAATHVEAWEAGTEAVINWRGKRFRIVCEGKDAPLIQTTRGILVGE